MEMSKNVQRWSDHLFNMFSFLHMIKKVIIRNIMYFVNANASFFLCRVVVVLLTTTKQNANSGLENQDIFRKGMKDY